MLATETAMTFAEAAKRLPRLNGKRVHVSTLWRWATKGLCGVRLESRRIGARFVTSIEALDRFSKELADIGPPERPAPPSIPKQRTTKQRAKSIEKAETTLRAAGLYDLP